MRIFFVLWKKELGAYVHTTAAAVAAAVFLTLSGLAAWVHAVHLSQGGLSTVFWGRPEPLFWLAMLVTAPLLTMHLFAEERRTGELEMRLAAPVTEAQVVLSKFAAAFAVWALLWVPVLFYPAVFRLCGAGDGPPGVAAFWLGALPVGSSFLAVGLFASLLTRRPVVAAMIAVAVLGATLAPGFGTLPAAFRLPPAWTAAISPMEHVRAFAAGVIDTRAIVWHVSGTVLVLFLSIRLLEARRAS